MTPSTHTTPKRLLRVFLSYAWRNSAERLALGQALSKMPGCKVMFDRQDIPAGDEIHRSIVQILERCDCLIALLTRDSLQSFELRDELSRAHAMGKHILPIVEAPVASDALPWFVRELKQIRYESTDFDAVVRAVKHHLRRLDPPVPSGQGPTRSPLDDLDKPQLKAALDRGDSLLLQMGVLKRVRGSRGKHSLEVSEEFEHDVEGVVGWLQTQEAYMDYAPIALYPHAELLAIYLGVGEFHERGITPRLVMLLTEAVHRRRNLRGARLLRDLSDEIDALSKALSTHYRRSNKRMQPAADARRRGSTRQC